MAENISLNSVATFQNDTTAVNTVNNNFAAITSAFTDVLSRSGVTPNPMLSTLDMNSNQIINLPPPQTVNSPARLIDVTTPGVITITTATTGTSGHTVPFLDGTNTWSAPQTIALPSGLGVGLSITETVSGATGGLFSANSIQVADVANAGSSFVNGLIVNQVFGQSSAQGGRQAIFGQAQLVAATNATNPNRNYVGVTGIGLASANDGGTGVTSVTGLGGMFGGNFQGNAAASASNMFGVSACEFNTGMQAGSSTWAKSVAQFSSGSNDAVNGAGINTMLWLYNQGGATAKWTNAILIDNNGGLGSFPMSTTGTIFKTGTGTTGSGIDLSATAFSGSSFAGPGFSVGGTGNIISGGAGISNGTIFLFGLTSGFLSLSTSSTSNQLTISQPVTIGAVGTTGGTVTLAGATSGSAAIFASATGSVLTTNNAFNSTSVLTSGAVGTVSGQLTLNGSTSGSVALTTPASSAGLLQFASAGSFSANGAVATALTAVGPVGSHTTVQTWLTIVDNGGVTRWIPCF